MLDSLLSFNVCKFSKNLNISLIVLEFVPKIPYQFLKYVLESCGMSWNLKSKKQWSQCEISREGPTFVCVISCRSMHTSFVLGYNKYKQSNDLITLLILMISFLVCQTCPSTFIKKKLLSCLTMLFQSFKELPIDA